VKSGYLVAGRVVMLSGRPCVLVEYIDPGALPPGETLVVASIPEGARVGFRIGATVGMKTAAQRQSC
jgi:hypothetical protein